jgi:DNA-binding XRE family transcriptional regulator
MKVSKSMSDQAIAGVLFKALEEIRIRKQIKQQELADDIGITPKTYRNLKTGKASVSTLLLVLRRLGLLDNLQLLVPEKEMSPIEKQKIEQVERQKLRTRKVVVGVGSMSAGQSKVVGSGKVMKNTDPSTVQYESTSTHEGNPQARESGSLVKHALMSRRKIKHSKSKDDS